MFHGTVSSYIEFPRKGGLDTRFSITLMCWVQPGGQDGPLIIYENNFRRGIELSIANGKFFHVIVDRPHRRILNIVRAVEVLPVGKWVHVAASYDHITGINSLYINGQLSVSRNIGKGHEIATDGKKVRMGAPSYNNNYFKGKIAEMEVYDVALNEAQIQTSVRQGSWKTTFTFLEIVVSLPSTVITETSVVGQMTSQEAADTRFRIQFWEIKFR